MYSSNERTALPSKITSGRRLGRRPYRLSRRELQVLQLIAEGKTNREIAALFGITVGTVAKHVSHVLSKMSAKSRTEAGLRAYREGLVD